MQPTVLEHLTIIILHVLLHNVVAQSTAVSAQTQNLSTLGEDGSGFLAFPDIPRVRKDERSEETKDDTNCFHIPVTPSSRTTHMRNKLHHNERGDTSGHSVVYRGYRSQSRKERTNAHDSVGLGRLFFAIGGRVKQ